MRIKVKFLLFCLIFSLGKLSAQIDTLQTKKTYWEDQLYVVINYNILRNQPSGLDPSGVSYGFSLGFIKDIPLNKEGTLALGTGIGYNYDLFSHSLAFDGSVFFTDDDVNTNRLKMYNVEFPIQLRWRTSDSETYSFWRVYFGPKFSYNFFHKFQYQLSGDNFEFSGLETFNNFQSGLELSAGYGAFNLYVYYGLSPVLKGAFLDDQAINSSILKLGLVFYIL